MRTYLVLFALAWCAACGVTDSDGLRLELSLSAGQVAVDDSVRVTLTLTNLSIRTVSVLPSDAYGYCSRAFQVFDAQDQEVALATLLCALALSIYAPNPVDLRPGAQITITDWWKPAESTLGGQPIGPGTYRIRGRVLAEQDAVVSGFAFVNVIP